MPDDAVVHIRHGSSIGQPLTRRDGPLKVTGAARYAADNHPAGMLHAVMATSSIARGRVTGLDVAAARAHPGVVEVMTPANAPGLAQHPDEKGNPFAFKLDLLQDDRVRYAGQPIAVVIAETLEAAAEGAMLLHPTYAAEPARVGLDGAEPFVPPVVGMGEEPDEGMGDVEAGLTAAARRVEATYETPAQYHNAMEPHAVVAVWDGDQLVLDTPTQGLAIAQGRLAGLLGIPPENIHIRSPFLGGGFGSKGAPWSPQVLGIMAARLVGTAGETGDAARPDVRAGGPSRTHAPDHAPGRRDGREADSDRASHPHRFQHLRRFFRTSRRRDPHAVCDAGACHQP
jgi:xanthine dehydrogenase YagR molybdenum-binding subunit